MNIATDLVKDLLLQVLSRAAGEIQLAWGFKPDDLKRLESQLNRLRRILNGADVVDQLYCFQADHSTSSSSNALVVDWLREVKSVAYDADDLLDEYAYEGFRRRLVVRSRFRDFFSLSKNPVVFRYRMADRVRELRRSIDATYKQAGELGIRPSDLVGGGQLRNRAVAVTAVDDVLKLRRERVDASDLIGREDDERRVVEMICGSTAASRAVVGELTVVVVVGIVGIGKTALSKRIFDNPDVKAHFHERIWVSVSRDFKVNILLKKIAEHVFGIMFDMLDDGAIIRKLKTKLNDQRYLLVLDDVWDTMSVVWEPLKSLLKDIQGSPGTTILITTRGVEVAAALKTKPHLIHQLKELAIADSWDLFQKQALSDRIISHSEKERAQKMVTKCKGVPLAIKVLANTLKSKDYDSWSMIDESEIWRDDRDILPSLKLSFDYLPSADIKRCFAYCAIFQEDVVIEKDNLIQLWIAQGLVQPLRQSLHRESNLSLEHIGEVYFNTLVNYSLFQDVSEDEHGNVKCKMHDAVLALAKYVSREEWLTLKEDTSIVEFSTEARHLHLKASNQRIDLKLKKQLRTVVITIQMSIPMLKNMLDIVNHLRVLCLVGIGLTKLPDVLGDLKHMRYLDISENSGVSEFPASITNLFNLQTLRCLNHQGSGKEEMKIPSGWSKLVNLRHFVMEDTGIEISKGMNQLRCLQTLPRLILKEGDSAARLSELGPLTNIRGRLILFGLDYVRSEEEASMAKLNEKPNVRELCLEWMWEEQNNSHGRVLEVLLPHPNLKGLILRSFMGKKLPGWLTNESVPSLMKLQVINCGSLTSMDLDCFLSLRFLHISFCDELSEIAPSLFEGCLNLQQLYIEWCELLTSVPDLKPLCNLKHLKIRHCRGIDTNITGLESLPNLEQLELGPFSSNIDYFPIGSNNSMDNYEHLPLSTSLQELWLFGWENLNSFPTLFQNCTNLTKLRVQSFQELEALPEWFGKLTALRSLELNNLSKLEYLPHEVTMLGLANLQELRITDCNLLRDKCKEQDGPEWSKISHIPTVVAF